MEGTLFKVGGSLLDWPELPERLNELLATHTQPLLVIGGGAAANVVREWDASFSLGEATSHPLAMQSLSLTARLIEQLLAGATCVASLDELQVARSQNQIPILLLADLVAAFEPYADIPLESSWQSTSDTLSLWLAWHLGLSRVTLLKSTEWQPVPSWEEAVALGLVDGNFPALARFTSRQNPDWKLSWCNLRRSTAIMPISGT